MDNLRDETRLIDGIMESVKVLYCMRCGLEIGDSSFMSLKEMYPRKYCWECSKVVKREQTRTSNKTSRKYARTARRLSRAEQRLQRLEDNSERKERIREIQARIAKEEGIETDVQRLERELREAKRERDKANEERSKYALALSRMQAGLTPTDKQPAPKSVIRVQRKK